MAQFSAESLALLLRGHKEEVCLLRLPCDDVQLLKYYTEFRGFRGVIVSSFEEEHGAQA